MTIGGAVHSDGGSATDFDAGNAANGGAGGGQGGTGHQPGCAGNTNGAPGSGPGGGGGATDTNCDGAADGGAGGGGFGGLGARGGSSRGDTGAAGGATYGSPTLSPLQGGSGGGGGGEFSSGTSWAQGGGGGGGIELNAMTLTLAGGSTVTVHGGHGAVSNLGGSGGGSGGGILIAGQYVDANGTVNANGGDGGSGGCCGDGGGGGGGRIFVVASSLSYTGTFTANGGVTGAFDRGPAGNSPDATGAPGTVNFVVEDLTVTGGAAITGLTEGVQSTQTVGAIHDPDHGVLPPDWTVTINWGDGTSDTCTPAGPTACGVSGGPLPGSLGTIQLVNCNVAGCQVQGTHIYKEESEAGSPYTITISATDADQFTQPPSATSTAQVSDNSLSPNGGNILKNGSGGTCNQFSPCFGPVAFFIDNNSFCNAEGEAINPTTGAPHYLITVNYGDGSGNQAPTAVSQPFNCHFTVYGSHVYFAPGVYTVAVTVIDEGCNDNPAAIPVCHIVITSTVTVVTPTPVPNCPATPSICHNLPYVSAASLSGDTHHYVAFVARWRSYTPIGYRGDLDYRDFDTGFFINGYGATGSSVAPGINAARSSYCSSYAPFQPYCSLTVQQLTCSGGTATVSGTYTVYTGVNAGTYTFTATVTLNSPSTFQLTAQKPGGGTYTGPAIPVNANIQCA
jgi:hypothetical protein